MSDAKRDFNKEAASWDDEPRRVKLAQDVADAIRAEVPLTRETDLLDFGCGTGLVSLQLQPHVRTVTCVDSAQGMLDVVEAKVRHFGLDNVKTQHVDLDAGQTLSGSYSLVVSSMTLHHIPDVDALLGQFARITRPGGRLCIADLDSEGGRFHADSTGVFHNGFDRAALKEAFARAGYTDIRDRTAAEITKPDVNGAPTPFSIFLVTATRP
jgi:ubiquinone/menaquinone biosynthesis C-methylase UbiE